jgi:iron complex outermembrane receptor protein
MRHAILCARLLACAVLLSSVGGAGSAEETTPSAAEAEKTEVATESTEAQDPTPDVLETGEAETATESTETQDPTPGTAEIGEAEAPAESAETPDWTQSIEEITVTARRREEKIQETPISITAFSEGALEERGMRDLTELTQYTPNLRFTASAGQSSNAQVYIRGIGQSEGTINAEPRVGIYLDDVYQARPLGSILSIVDLQRIEVLRGPQGTLYGKNAIGGAINIISNRPGPEYSARGEIGYGNLNQLAARLTANAPVAVAGLGDKLFLRGNVFYEHRDGYVWDVNLEEHFASNDLLGGRAAIRFLPVDTLDTQLTYSQTRQPRKSTRGECALVADQQNSYFMQAVQDTFFFIPALESLAPSTSGEFIEECETSHEYRISTDVENKDEINTRKIHGRLNWDTPEIPLIGSLSVDSITAYQWLKQDFNFDWDSTALTLIESEIRDLEIAQVSQELRVHGAAWEERAQWTAGVFYLWEDSWGPPTHTVGVVPFNLQASGPPTFFPVKGTIDELSDFRHETAAGYLFGSVDPIDRLHLTLGFRFGWERKTLRKTREIYLESYSGTWSEVFKNPDGDYNLGGAILFPSHTNASVTDSWTAPTGNLNITYDITDDVHIYAGGQRGFSSGGFNYIGDDEEETPNAFDPEALDGGEVGVKTTWLDGRLVVNASYFWNYYHDMQIRTTEATRQGTSQQLFGVRNVIRNAGNAWLMGGELEVTGRPVEGLLLIGSLGLTFPHYEHFELLNEDATKAASTGPGGNLGDIVPIYDDLSDNDFTNSPKVNFGLMAIYTWAISDDVELAPSADYYFQSKVYFDVRNTPELSQDAYGLLNSRLTLDLLPSDTSISLWVKNLLDERYLTGGFNLGSYVSRYWGPPRTFGITITQRLESD